MSAPGIPHLLTLRKGARGGARGGAAAAAGSTGNRSQQAQQIDRDRIIRDTDNDASGSRISAVEAGYLDDPFAKYLCNENWQIRLPLMNRGTYVRTTAIDRVVETFLSSTITSSTPTNDNEDTPGTSRATSQSCGRQIISLGAGSDTRYFRLKRDKKYFDFKYHELDFPDNNRVKIARLKDSRFVELVKKECDVDLSLAETNSDASGFTLGDYSIHALDLRDLPKSLPWLDSTAPTLLISECCLIYLSPDAADKTLKYFSDQLRSAPLAIVVYEPFRPNDSFGQTMIRNLMGRGIVLQTIEKYADLEKQKGRMQALGLDARSMDCEQIWRSWISSQEKDRIDKLEWMDEVEEFVLLAKHYCVAWGWRRFADHQVWEALGTT